MYQLRVCHKLTTRLRREIVLGSSSIEDPPQYITVIDVHCLIFFSSIPLLFKFFYRSFNVLTFFFVSFYEEIKKNFGWENNFNLWFYMIFVDVPEIKDASRKANLSGFGLP